MSMKNIFSMGKIIDLGFVILLSFSTSIMSFAQVNYDEEKVPEYKLPEILVSRNGKVIKNPSDWENIRRPEILDLFEKNMYGRFPGEVITIGFETIETDRKALDDKAIRKNIHIILSNGTDSIRLDMQVFLPSHSNYPAPLFLGLNFNGNHTIVADPTIPVTRSWVRNNSEYNIVDNKATDASRGKAGSRWPVEKIIEKGYGLATIYYGDIDPDFDDDFKNGIHSLIDNSTENDPEMRSSISAWAYGLSLAMDYFETDDAINQDQVIVIGHSRLGKAALWGGASDRRFAMVISNDSGCGGAALSRRQFGETVKAINTQFPHWFCKNFHNYNDRVDDLPVDQHMLISLMAPRPVYVASAHDDQWADPKGEFLSLYESGAVYELFKLKGIREEKLPLLNEPVRSGNVGYHNRSGEHDITLFDWEQYLDFADHHFKRPVK